MDVLSPFEVEHATSLNDFIRQTSFAADGVTTLAHSNPKTAAGRFTNEWLPIETMSVLRVS